MKAFILDRYKKKEAMRFGDMPEPQLRDGDALVEIHAAGLNQLDAKIRDGEFKGILRYRLPLILGNDVAGVVVKVGPKVRRFNPGDEVYARPDKDRIGTFAEFITIDEADVALKPKNLGMEAAASVPLVGLTAWQVLVERAKLKKGQARRDTRGRGSSRRGLSGWRFRPRALPAAARRDAPTPEHVIRRVRAAASSSWDRAADGEA